MTAPATAAPTDGLPVGELPAANDRFRVGDLLAAEWLKLRTLRANWLITGLGLLAALVLSLLGCDSAVRHWGSLTPQEQQDFDSLQASFGGFTLLQLAVTVLGVLAVSGEYGTGLIRTSFTAVPARRALSAAKAAVLAGTALTVGAAGALVSFTACQAMLATEGHGLPLASAAALRAIAATALHLAGLALIGLSLAVLFRHGAGAITAAFALLFVAPVFLRSDDGWTHRVYQVLPGTALRQLTAVHLDTRFGPSVPVAWLTLLAYPLAALAVVLPAVHRRDV